MNSRWLLFLMLVVLGACRAHADSAPAAPPVSRAALSATPITWATRAPAAVQLPRSARRLQLVVTGGWARGEHFAWLISNGTDVIHVYRTTMAELSQVIDEVARMVYPTVGTPLDQLSFGVLGSFKQPPPPPPPDPGGFPAEYVRHVMGTAWRMDRETVRLDEEMVLR